MPRKPYLSLVGRKRASGDEFIEIGGEFSSKKTSTAIHYRFMPDRVAIR